MEPVKTIDEASRLIKIHGRTAIVPFICEKCGKPSEKTLRKLREHGFLCKSCRLGDSRRVYGERSETIEVKTQDDVSSLGNAHPKQKVLFTCERCGKHSTLEIKKARNGLVCASCKKALGNTKFERSATPISVSSYLEAKALEGKYRPQQKVSHQCSKCSKTAVKYLMNVDEKMLCHGCAVSEAQHGQVRKRDPNAKRVLATKNVTVTCPQCGKTVTRQTRTMTDHLCRKCRLDRTAIEKFGSVDAFNKAKVKKQEETCFKKYGVKCFAQTPGFTLVKQAKYEYKGKRFDSSWELAYFVYLESLAKAFVYKPDGVPYQDSLGKTLMYYPDFLVDGRLVEIKGGQFLKDGHLVSPYNDSRKESRQRKDKAKSELMARLNVDIISTVEIQPILKMVGRNFLKAHKVLRGRNAKDK